MCLDLFDIFNHRFDAMVLGHQGQDELDVVADDDKERDTFDKHKIVTQGDRLVFLHDISGVVDVCGLELVRFGLYGIGLQ